MRRELPQGGASAGAGVTCKQHADAAELAEDNNKTFDTKKDDEVKVFSRPSLDTIGLSQPSSSMNIHSEPSSRLNQAYLMQSSVPSSPSIE